MEQDDPDTYHDLVGFEGDWRDSWWNEDFLSLMSERWALGSAGRMLDVGCGVGHWGQRLFRYLPESSELVGVDHEGAFLVTARARAAERGWAERASYVEADVAALPFPDDHFDIATCQTVLMHVGDPTAVLREMARVVRPGGRIAVAEPHNGLSVLSEYWHHPHVDPHTALELVGFFATIWKGKIAMGGGDDCIATRLPGLFEEAGLVDLVAHQSDRCALVRPPYGPVEQRDVDMRLTWFEAGAFGGGTEADVRARHRAGGGTDADFERFKAKLRTIQAADAERMRAGTWSATGAFSMLLMTGRVEGPKT